MNLYPILVFFYGSFGGAVSCIVFFFVIFRHIEQMLSDTVRKKARKHAEFDAVAKEAAVVTPAKVETLCKLVRFDDGILSEAIQCRMVFYSGTIDIYKVDELRTLPDHRQEVVVEHMLGRISCACIEATGERISKYHRHHNKSTRYAAVKGKCTVVRHKDGLPLFLEDPAMLLKARLKQIRKEQQEQMLVDRMRRHAKHGGVMLSEEQARQRIREAGGAAIPEGFLAHLVSASGATELYDEVLHMSTAAVGGCGGQAGNTQNKRVQHGSNAKQSRQQRRKDRAGPSPEDEVPLSQWTCLAIKFPTRRVQERWLNLLQATPQSAQWHEFIRHLPKIDVFNLLIARLFFENSRANALHDLLEEKLKKKLVRVSQSLPQRLHGNIYLDALDVGNEIPLISDVSDPTSSSCGDTEFDFEVLYRGGFALKIRFAITYREIRVPDIIFSITVLELAGRMRFAVGPPPTQKFWLGCQRPPQLRLAFTQEVASHDGLLNAVLKMLPDMSQIASNVVTFLFFEDMVFPSMDDLPWPVLGAENSESEAEDDGEWEKARAFSEVKEVTDVGDISFVTQRKDEVTVKPPTPTPAGEKRDAKTEPTTAMTKAKAAPAAFTDAPLSSDSPHLRGSTTPDMRSPPPRPPVLSAVSAGSIDVPQRHLSSLGNPSPINEESPHRMPPLEGPPAYRSRNASLSSASAALPGLPPRAPRLSGESDSGARGVAVPSSRGSGSATARVTSFGDFKEPED